MYSPYGSYSSMSSAAQPMEIPTSSYLSSPAAAGSGYSYSASCAFPSWPQRSSLHEAPSQERATSYLSDDDLFPCDGFEDDAHSVSSSGSATPTSPHLAAATEVDMLQMQRDQMAMQREAIKFLLTEKERRRQQFKKQRRSSSGSSSKKGTPKSKSTHLDAITEAGE